MLEDMKKIAFAIGLALVATSCAPKYNAGAERPVSTMSCTEMSQEFKKLQGMRAEAQDKSGFSKENVALAVLFFPGAVINELDARDVTAKIDKRSAELNQAAAARRCAPLAR